jgi:hypothetical protein
MNLLNSNHNMRLNDPKKNPIMKLTLNLHNLEALRNNLLDLFVFVLQQAQCERDVVPLPLRFAPLQSCGKFIGKLFRMFILLSTVSEDIRQNQHEV